MNSTLTRSRITCFHCGDECRQGSVTSEGKTFCCEGCKLVHELLQENQLCTYYQLENHPGNKPAEIFISHRFAWLDDAEIVRQLLTFSEKDTAVVRFSIPRIHCVSCIWLLENLHKLEAGVLKTRVNFLEKTASITFNRSVTTLRRVVEALHRIGYEPDLHFNDFRNKAASTTDRSLIYKIGVAAFCFGNIMMLSFPEYLTGVGHIEPELKSFFSYLNLLLAIPVFFYSAGDYFINSWKSARRRYFSIDLPIALGLMAMLLRSTWEIFTGTGPGYFDSMTGLVFFLLVGRYVQSVTHRSMSFERDYQSYFPVAVAVRKKGEEVYTPISRLVAGDKMVIHSNELIPADALLLQGAAHIDYSFVTGESEPVTKSPGELIYAGGKQTGATITVQVQKTVEQSHLTQLWNHEVFQKGRPATVSQLADTISKYFTISIILIAVVTALFWFPADVHRGILACTAILIIACPCALAIAVPFTLGNILRILGRNHFYLKNAQVVESVSKCNAVVFDKTGTLTVRHGKGITWEGPMLTGHQWKLAGSLASQSIHPLSKMIATLAETHSTFPVHEFTETAGQGLEAKIDGVLVRMGSASFIHHMPYMPDEGSCVHLAMDAKYLGCFHIRSQFRPQLKEVLQLIAAKFPVYLLSGDREGDRHRMEEVFPDKENLFFNQSPGEKLQQIGAIQATGKRVMMIGDGLNDAGALQKAEVGIAVSDDLHQFAPACDVIMKGSVFSRLPQLVQLCQRAMYIIWFTFGISLLYNVVGIYFAVQGLLSPMIAAILMPLSSLSVILITTLASRWAASRLGLLTSQE